MNKPLSCLLVIAAVISTAIPSSAQDSATIILPESIVWKSHPLFPGAQSAVLYGDPSKPGIVVQRNKLPPNFKIPPHMHSFVEAGTVISGSVGHGEGDKFDADKGVILKAGAGWVLPAGSPHFLWTGGEEAVFQFIYNGPAIVTFTIPADDPRKK